MRMSHFDQNGSETDWCKIHAGLGRHGDDIFADGFMLFGITEAWTIKGSPNKELTDAKLVLIFCSIIVLVKFEHKLSKIKCFRSL
jgi:hypothetical protein